MQSQRKQSIHSGRRGAKIPAETTGKSKGISETAEAKVHSGLAWETLNSTRSARGSALTLGETGSIVFSLFFVFFSCFFIILQVLLINNVFFSRVPNNI